ncbi:MAG: NADH:ubiquinone reductase (Na(+)-transporting) subunit C [Cyclobacteriaceae bacterium]|nr:NADH:ubiquinone reductase (Na(+)-transporting) subunit C [Cyclobacteriaceae bacterium]MCK5209846.1 NADH:ubiquinone reductase (Na(+)-transporting) subunit C [Cyclobacteriaceae bacterium]MCK5279667.1 NADH:ubiquinone reductase (Na(+)-transporting) subunit C [Cyclobacteriaceae bacterium]MCK5370689.1 NADH:ubiquinone reductase (Na(+)-transporting) subunit C [Cyclobacteriaceae bacterium]MCK5467919.1 NADH:ubiquinone reductase (Na(+)-transporting) subunit C [Cyclobacteriaceae bacterium]
MQQSNTYVIVFSAILTIVLGGLLSLANQGLKPMQQKSVELDTKKKILSAVTDLKGKKGNEILELYGQTIESIVVNLDGDPVEKDEKGSDIEAEKVNIAKNFKKAPEDRMYPVFKYHKAGDKDAVEAYIFPVYGKGLWGPIWGFIALETDLNTIKGTSFDHKSETPGLGSRITSTEVRNRYNGKKVFDDSGNLVSISMLKGENNSPNVLDDHHIDGLSGATLTAYGVNDMLDSYFKYYQGYINKLKNATEKVALLY